VAVRGGGEGKAGCRLIINLYQRAMLVCARVVFSLMLQTYPCNNATYINTSGTYQGYTER
jgi:hypothetical protein